MLLQDVITQKSTLNLNTVALQVDMVCQIQVRLIQLGFLAGAADGKLNPATRRSLNAFQIAHDLPTEYLIPETAAALLDGEPNSGSIRPKTNSYEF